MGEPGTRDGRGDAGPPGGPVCDATRAERWLAAALGLVVRLWCLPLLLLVWALAWVAIGIIYAAAALAHQGRPGPGGVGVLAARRREHWGLAPTLGASVALRRRDAPRPPGSPASGGLG
jgi:hypothetical protein